MLRLGQTVIVERSFISMAVEYTIGERLKVIRLKTEAVDMRVVNTKGAELFIDEDELLPNIVGALDMAIPYLVGEILTVHTGFCSMTVPYVTGDQIKIIKAITNSGNLHIEVKNGEWWYIKKQDLIDHTSRVSGFYGHSHDTPICRTIKEPNGLDGYGWGYAKYEDMHKEIKKVKLAPGGIVKPLPNGTDTMLDVEEHAALLGISADYKCGGEMKESTIPVALTGHLITGEEKMVEQAKSYFSKHQETFFTLGVVVLFDHFFLKGALRQKIQDAVEKLLGNAVKAIEQKES